MQPVSVQVLLFAKAKDLSGTNKATITINPDVDYKTLLNTIVQTFSLDAIKNNIILAINEEYPPSEGILNIVEGDKIAVIPPLSGGLVDSKLNVEELVDLVKSPKCGAVSVFMGTTRDNCDGLKVARLVYEAYETMAHKAMKKVCNEVRKKWPDVVHIAIYHRTGVVPVTEASVVIAVSSPHRQDSLNAIQFAIDSLKASVPVWKKEEYEDSEVEAKWKENKECAWTSAT